MKALHTLIKLNQRALDEKRRELTQLLKYKEELEAGLASLEEQFKKEQKIASEHLEYMVTFPRYADAVRIRRQKFRELLGATTKQIIKFQDEIAEVFAELKRFEIIEEVQAKREAAKEARRETLMLDELGIAGFVRNQGANN